MKNFTYLFKKFANTPPVEFKGASQRNCTTNFSWIALVLPLWQSRSDSVSIVSRQSVLAILLMLLTLFVGVGQVWGDYYTITFANSASQATAITSTVNASTTIAESSRSYVTTQPYTVNSGNCYYGDTQSCIRIGKSGNSSSLSIALSTTGSVSATTIVVNCNNTGGNKNSDATLSVNGTATQTTSETADDYTFTINSDITSITLAGSASIKIYSITVNYTPAVTKTLSSIAVKTAPTKTAYLEGENFAPAGLVITATYSDASTEDISYAGNTNKFSFSPATNAALTTSNTSVTVTYGEKNCSQSINVYSVTVNVVDESGNALSGEGMPTASATGKNITASASGNNYVFKQWEAVTAAGTSFAASGDASTMLNGTPTGNVTIKAVYHKPISVTWKVNNGNWNDKGGTETVAYNTAWSSLTLPTAPVPNEDGCGNKFMGWTTTNIGAVGLTEEEDISALVIMDSSNKSGLSTKITENITFYAVFADYKD